MSKSNGSESDQNWCSDETTSTSASSQDETQSNSKVQGIGAFFCIITLIRTKLGAGIIGLPYAVYKIGFVTALWIQLAYIWIWIFAIYLMLQVRLISGESTLPSIGYYWYGRIGIFLVNSLIAIAQLGFPIIFFIVFGDVAGGLIRKINITEFYFLESRWFTHVLLGGWMLYLVLKKDISSLKYVGLIWSLLIFSFIFLYFIHYAISNPSDNPKTDMTETRASLRFWASIPTILASYAIHNSYYAGFNALKEKTCKNGLKVGTISLLIMFFTYQATSLLSYGLYGGNIKPNMLIGLLSFEGILPVMLLIIFLFIVVMYIPTLFFIGKDAVFMMYDELTKKSISKKCNSQTCGRSHHISRRGN